MDSPTESTVLLLPANYRLDAREKLKRIFSEFRILLYTSLPVILAYTLQNSFQAVSILVVGRISAEALAISAFSYMFAMATAMLIALGGTTAIDTLASSSFTGSNDRHNVGVVLQRALIVLSLFYVPVAALWIFSAPLFRALGQEENLARDSARFLTVLVPGGLGYIFFESLKKFLQAQGIVKPGTYAVLVTAPLNGGLNYLFVHTFRLGLLGAPLATGIAFWSSFLLLLLYVRFVAGGDYWGGWSMKCLNPRGLGIFARLAFLGILHVGSEWWAFEIVALAAGRLGTVALAAQSVLMTSDQVFNTIPFGVGMATSARIGNFLGSHDGRGAARVANTAPWLSIALGGLVLSVLIAAKDDYAKMFNDDVGVVQLTAEVMPYVALFQVSDGLNESCGGALRGMGKQHVGALVNLISYYFLALPLGLDLAFHRRWGLKGLWAGLCVALSTAGLLQWVIVARTKWDIEVDKALKRLEEEDVRPLPLIQ